MSRNYVAALGCATFLWVSVLTLPKDVSDPAGWSRTVEAASCPEGMVSVQDRFCIDAFEAHTVVIDAPRTKGRKPKIIGSHSPYEPIGDDVVMAVSAKGKVPQGYISRDEAEKACVNAGKRLCGDDEWLSACRGKKPTKFPYGDEHREGACNDRGVSGFNKLYGPGNGEPPQQSAYTLENMNDPKLNRLAGTVAKTGAFGKCKNSYKIFDMVGNLHEWTAAKEGTFRGGYYLDTTINGEGCDYRTTAHHGKYHDYSTGFRCCYGGPKQKQIESGLAAASKSKKKDSPEEKAPKGKAGAKVKKKTTKKTAKKS